MIQFDQYFSNGLKPPTRKEHVKSVGFVRGLSTSKRVSNVFFRRTNGSSIVTGLRPVTSCYHICLFLGPATNLNLCFILKKKKAPLLGNEFVSLCLDEHLNPMDRTKAPKFQHRLFFNARLGVLNPKLRPFSTDEIKSHLGRKAWVVFQVPNGDPVVCQEQVVSNPLTPFFPPHHHPCHRCHLCHHHLYYHCRRHYITIINNIINILFISSSSF